MSSLTSDRFERSAFDVLMSLAVEKVLPKAPCTGKSNSQTAFDRLMGDLLKHLKTKGLGFPSSICDSEGMYVVRSLGRALWSLTVATKLW